ncbi:MAG: TIGR03087 family PEP-CTERM/XrtA system glycosyltransferase [Gammaproteobacteria bacterium]
MKNLLFLAHRIPYPPNKGDKIRSCHLLHYLSRAYRVYLGSFIDDPSDWAHTGTLKSLCAETRFVALHPLRAHVRSLAALASGEPLSVRYYWSQALKHWVDGLLNAGAIERVLIFSSAMAQYLPAILPEGIRRVIDFVDMDSEKWRQYSRSKPWPMSWIYAREGASLFAFERRQAMLSEASVFVSEAEAGLFKTQAPETAERVTYLENGVDTEYFAPHRCYPNPYPEDGRILVFTGAMDYWANVDAVCWFAKEVFPAVQARLADARFYIVGAKPTAAVRGLTEIPGVFVTGAVEDVRPYLAHATAAVAPLRIARGVQNKVLEAMAMAKPVLATREAMEGIRADPQLRGLIVQGPEQAIACALSLLNGPEQGIGELARQSVLRGYNWKENLTRIIQLLEGTHSVNTLGTR